MPDAPNPPVAHAADDPTPYRRSLRASRARREQAARRERRMSRGRRSLGAAVLTMTLATGGALAAGPASVAPTKAAAPAGAIRAAQRVLGVTADGVVGPVTRRAVRAFQRRHHLTVDGVIGPQTLAALGVAAGDPAAAAARSTGASSLLESIALCESGGDPTQVSSSGRYRGKYQFDRATWRSVGGSGDPAAASEAEQDRRAATLMAQRGPSAWPACSAKVGA